VEFLIRPFRRDADRPILVDDAGGEPTVVASRPLAEVRGAQEEIVRSDAKVAELLLNLVRETARASNDETQLMSVIAEFAFHAFPSATHHVLALKDPDAPGGFRPLIARSRSGDEPDVTLSRTIVSRVISEGLAVLVTHTEKDMAKVDSIALSGLQTAICAPLTQGDTAFGIVQLDIRNPGKGVFTSRDVDLLSVFASQVSLALDHLHLFQQQRRALQSTINALVHSLTLKDPETAQHSERVQAVALEIGREMGLSGRELEILGVAAILHDLGKQGVRDDVLFKPDRLTEGEREEMAHHAAYTQTILDKIEYPEQLKEVPKIAAYHHEKMDGSGPFGIPGAEIPRASRIISVADVFDALMSPRTYKDPMSVDQVVGILEKGKGVDWDPLVVSALRQIIPDLEHTLYAAPAPGAVPDAEPLDEAA